MMRALRDYSCVPLIRLPHEFAGLVKGIEGCRHRRAGKCADRSRRRWPVSPCPSSPMYSGLQFFDRDVAVSTIVLCVSLSLFIFHRDSRLRCHCRRAECDRSHTKFARIARRNIAGSCSAWAPLRRFGDLLRTAALILRRVYRRC